MSHDPGGKVLLQLPLSVKGAAVFGGPNNEYRYQLSRTWDEGLATVLFVMMNPSTADPMFDDPTVAKCGRYAKDWGFGTLLVGNTFAYRATAQKQLRLAEDPCGPENDMHLVDMAQRASMIVFAYGKPHKSLCYRGPQVARDLWLKTGKSAHALKLCADGTPSHPLYLKGDLKPQPWLVL